MQPMQNEIDSFKQDLEDSSNHCLLETPVANSDSLESNQTTKMEARSRSVSKRRMSFNENTACNLYNKCIGCCDYKEKIVPRAKSVPMKRKSKDTTNDNKYLKDIRNLEEKQNKKQKTEKEIKNFKQNKKSEKVSNHHLPEIATKEKNVPPFSPIAFPDMVNLNPAEVQQDIKIKRCGAPRKQPNPDLIQPNQSKPQIAKRTQSNSVGEWKISEVNIKSKINEHSFESNHQISKQMTRRNQSQSVSVPDVIRSDTVSNKSLGSFDPKKKLIPTSKPVSVPDVIRSDIVSNKSLGSFDPKKKLIPTSKPVCMEIMDENIPKKNLDLEIPNLNIKKHKPLYSISGTENMFDDAFIKRHLKYERKEIQQKRWEIQRIRELDRIAHLKRGRNKRQSVNSDEDKLTANNLADITIKVI